MERDVKWRGRQQPEELPGRERPPAAAEPGTAGSRFLPLMAVVAVVLVVAFLKWSEVATMPVAFALFLIALAWPLQARLRRHMPHWASFLLTVLALLLVVTLFFAALWWSGQMVAERAPQYAGRVQAIYQEAVSWARAQGFEVGTNTLDGAVGPGLAQSFVQGVAASLSLGLLILALAILGLNEVHAFRVKTEEAFPRDHRAQHIVDNVEKIVDKFQRYLLARTVAAVLQGISYWGFAMIMGLDFAFVWGVMAFLLNYIPTIGSAVAVVPPTLFALIQFDGYGKPLGVFLGLALLQLLFGNYLDPIIEGRFLSLSPVVVLISIVFWGWAWGIPGALLGVPITIAVVIATDYFPHTRWIAKLLARQEAAKKMG